MTARALQTMRRELEKNALAAPQEGKAEKYLPWYGAAAGGVAGAHAASKLVPKKYQLAGQLAGTLLGTGLGVHGGEAVGKRIDKVAAAEKKEKKPSSPLRVLGTSLAGMAAGTAAGVAVPKLIDAGLKKVRGHGISPGTTRMLPPVIGGALGMAAPLLHYATLQRMREEHTKKQEAQRGSQGN